MTRFKSMMLVVCLALVSFASSATESKKFQSATPAKSSEVVSEVTTSDLQQLEVEVMQLNAELQILEEDLLYPPSSRIAVYFSMDIGELFALDAVTIKLNGEDISHHLYTQRELLALYRGGVQQLYLGNAKQGTNRLTAFFTGIGPHDRPYKRATQVEFEQSFEPVYVELQVTDSTASQQPEFVAKVF